MPAGTRRWRGPCCGLKLDPCEILFRCDPALEAHLPRPVPARAALPEWLRVMADRERSPLHGQEVRTVKQCPPFIDAMCYGFIMPLPCDSECCPPFQWMIRTISRACSSMSTIMSLMRARASCWRERMVTLVFFHAASRSSAMPVSSGIAGDRGAEVVVASRRVSQSRTRRRAASQFFSGARRSADYRGRKRRSGVPRGMPRNGPAGVRAPECVDVRLGAPSSYAPPAAPPRSPSVRRRE